VKLAYRAFLFMLCLNMGALMMKGLGIGGVLTPTSTGQLESAWNSTEVVSTWSWPGTGSLVGDVMSGLRFFWTRNVPFIESFMSLLTSAGCPWVILEPIRVVWRFLWFTFVIEFISGRPVSGG